MDFVGFTILAHKNPHKESSLCLRHLRHPLTGFLLENTVHKIELLFGQLFINNTHTHPLINFVLYFTFC